MTGIEITLIVTMGMLVWIVIGVVWFITQMGNKHKKYSPWYEYVILAPIMSLMLFSAWLADRRNP